MKDNPENIKKLKHGNNKNIIEKWQCEKIDEYVNKLSICK